MPGIGCAAASRVVSPTIKSLRIFSSAVPPTNCGSRESGSAPLPRLSTSCAIAALAIKRRVAAKIAILIALDEKRGARLFVKGNPARPVLVQIVAGPSFDVWSHKIAAHPEEEWHE